MGRPGRGAKLTVDVAALAALHHVCDGCSGRVLAHSCCARFEVWVTRKEMQRITGLLPDVAKVCPHLQDGDDLDNVFEDEGEGHFSIDKRDDGLCAFAFEEDGMIRCGVHAAAAANGLDGLAAKPLECALWPFTLSESPPWVLSVDEEALSFHCCAAPEQAGLDPSVTEHLRIIVGDVAAEMVVRAAEMRRTEIIIEGDWRGGVLKKLG